MKFLQRILFFLTVITIDYFKEIATNEPYYAIFILGHSSENLYKNELLNKILPNLEANLKSKTFTIFYAGEENHQTIERQFSNDFVQTVPIGSYTNLTIIFSSKGTDEMALDELNLLHEIVYYLNEGTLVVEIGRQAIQTGAIFKHSSYCWAKGNLDINAPNSLLLCNNILPQELPILKNAKIEQLNGPTTTKSVGQIWPSIVVSAEDTDEVSQKPKSRRRTIQPNKRQIQLIKQRKRLGKQGQNVKDGSMEEQQIPNFDRLGNQDKKLACKYRKSCYASGKLTLDEIEQNVKEEIDGGTKLESSNISNDEDEDINELELKLLCKYRLSCYSEVGMSMSEENKRKSAVLSGNKLNLSPETKKKMRRTVKDIAKIALKEVEEKREIASKRPVTQESIVKQKLHEIEEKLDAKIKCKYRRSCYESGKLPEIEASALGWVLSPFTHISTFIPTFYSSKEEKSVEKKQDDAKLHCKYRKSCYQTGVLPEIEGFVKEDKSITKFDQNKPIPTTLDDLRLQCKYRTSCYQSRAQSEPAVEDSDLKQPYVEKKKENVADEKQENQAEKTNTKKSKEQKNIEIEQIQVEIPKEKAKKGKKSKIEQEIVPLNVKEAKKTKTKKQKIQEPDQASDEAISAKKQKKQKAKVEEQIRMEAKNNEEKVVKAKAIKEKPHKLEEKEHPHQEHLPKKANVDESEKIISLSEVDPIKCKYRKSCMASGILPKISTSEQSVFSGITSYVQDIYKISEPKDKADILKGERTPEKCKYRKSCYETGRLPDTNIEYSFFGGILNVVHKLNKHTEEKHPTHDHILERTKLACKYRKSCYEKYGIGGVLETAEKVVGIQANSELKLSNKTKDMHKEKQKSAKLLNASGEETNDETSEKKDKRKNANKKKQKEDKDEQPYMQANKTILKTEELTGQAKNLTTEHKLICRYRHSCYNSIDTNNRDAIRNERIIQLQLQREDCNRFRISCMKKMGMPVKERTPIINGKRMCRKKKPIEV